MFLFMVVNHGLLGMLTELQAIEMWIQRLIMINARQRGKQINNLDSLD